MVDRTSAHAFSKKGSMVGRTGFEPATFCTSSFGRKRQLNAVSLKELMEMFNEFQVVDLQRAKKTAKEKVYYVRKFFNEIQLNPLGVNVLDVRHYLRDLDCSVHVYKNVLGALKVFFRDFLDRPGVVASFKFPRPAFKPKVIPSKEDLLRFFDALDSEVGEVLFLFYASSGLRKSEVLGLNESNFDLERRMIMPNGHNGVTKSSYVSFYNLEAEEALNNFKESIDRLFKVSDRQYKKIWKNAARQSGVHITAQKLREWFCCEMGTLGVSDRYIDAFCGRVPKSVLARNYTDYSPERLRRIYEEADLKVLA
jgi:integrase